MKKTLILFLGLLLLTVSCSRSDDAPTESPSIVGTWKLEKMIINGQTTYFDDACSGQSKTVFHEDGTGKDEFWYYLGDGCEKIEEVYTYTYDRWTRILTETSPILGTQTVKVNFVNDNKIVINIEVVIDNMTIKAEQTSIRVNQ